MVRYKARCPRGRCIILVDHDFIPLRGGPTCGMRRMCINFFSLRNLRFCSYWREQSSGDVPAAWMTESEYTDDACVPPARDGGWRAAPARCFVKWRVFAVVLLVSVFATSRDTLAWYKYRVRKMDCRAVNSFCCCCCCCQF